MPTMPESPKPTIVWTRLDNDDAELPPLASPATHARWSDEDVRPLVETVRQGLTLLAVSISWGTSRFYVLRTDADKFIQEAESALAPFAEVGK